MIRRPSRTALHSALSALAGGLRGTAMQREQEQARAQQSLANQRAALRDAIDLAEMGATVATPEQIASVTPPPTVEFGGQRYVIPSLEERTRRRAEAEANARRKAQLEDERKARQQQEQANRRAFGAARIVVPDVVPGAYDPNVDYASVISAARSRQAQRPDEVTAAEVRQQELEAQRAAKRAEARAWLSTAASRMSQDERNRIGSAVGDLISGSGMQPDDALVAVMEAENRRAEAAYQDAQRRRALADVVEPGTTTTQTGTGAMAPTPPGATPPPQNFMPPVNVPTSPAATPARPAQPAPVMQAPAAPRKYTPADLDAAFDALGPDATSKEVEVWLLANRP